MNWVEYLEDNYHIQYPTTSDKIVRAFDTVALTIQYREGWDSYSVACTTENLHFSYSKDGSLTYVKIPFSEIAKHTVIKPILEEAIKTQKKGESTFRLKQSD